MKKDNETYEELLTPCRKLELVNAKLDNIQFMIDQIIDEIYDEEVED